MEEWPPELRYKRNRGKERERTGTRAVIDEGIINVEGIGMVNGRAESWRCELYVLAGKSNHSSPKLVSSHIPDHR